MGRRASEKKFCCHIFGVLAVRGQPVDFHFNANPAALKLVIHNKIVFHAVRVVCTTIELQTERLLIVIHGSQSFRKKVLLQLQIR